MRQRRRNALGSDLDEMDEYFRSAERLRTESFYDRYSNVYTQRWSELPGKILEARYRDWTGNDSRLPPASLAEIVERTGIDPKTVRGVMNSIVEAFAHERDRIRREAAAETRENLLRATQAREEQVEAVDAALVDDLYCVVRPSLGRAIFLVDAKMLSPRDKIIVSGTLGTCSLVYRRLLEAFPDLEWDRKEPS
jgi:hypothetical protein